MTTITTTYSFTKNEMKKKVPSKKKNGKIGNNRATPGQALFEVIKYKSENIKLTTARNIVFYFI